MEGWHVIGKASVVGVGDGGCLVVSSLPSENVGQEPWFVSVDTGKRPRTTNKSHLVFLEPNGR